MTMPSGVAPVLEIEGLSISYRSAAGEVRPVEDADLTLAPGEVLGLLGESGSGKSTLAYGCSVLLR